MEYKEILDSIYNGLVSRQGIEMYGSAGMKALRELEDILDADEYLDIEELFTEGFSENARNGFYHGFRCALTLLTGNIGGFEALDTSSHIEPLGLGEGRKQHGKDKNT